MIALAQIVYTAVQHGIVTELLCQSLKTPFPSTRVYLYIVWQQINTPQKSAENTSGEFGAWRNNVDWAGPISQNCFKVVQRIMADLLWNLVTLYLLTLHRSPSPQHPPGLSFRLVPWCPSMPFSNITLPRHGLFLFRRLDDIPWKGWVFRPLLTSWRVSLMNTSKLFAAHDC